MWNVDLEHPQAFLELRFRTATDYDGGHRVVPHWKLDRRSFQGHAITLAHRAHPYRTLEERRRSVLVVVVSAGPRVGEDAAVVDAAGDDRDASLQADRQQLLQ